MESAAGGGSAERMWPGSAQCSNVQMSENTGVSEAAAAAGLMVYYPASPIISVIVQTVQLGIIIPWARQGPARDPKQPSPNLQSYKGHFISLEALYIFVISFIEKLQRLTFSIGIYCI